MSSVFVKGAFALKRKKDLRDKEERDKQFLGTLSRHSSWEKRREQVPVGCPSAYWLKSPWGRWGHGKLEGCPCPVSISDTVQLRTLRWNVISCNCNVLSWGTYVIHEASINLQTETALHTAVVLQIRKKVRSPTNWFASAGGRPLLNKGLLKSFSTYTVLRLLHPATSCGSLV